MALRNMKTYTQATAVQDKAVDIFGEPCTLFKPTKPVRMQGYENEVEYEQLPAKCFIDFHVKRRWFYHLNWFPENEDRLSITFFPLSSPINVDWFVRTKTIEHVSPCGDLLFRVVKVADDGKYFTLRRAVFLYAIDDASLYKYLEVKV